MSRSAAVWTWVLSVLIALAMAVLGYVRVQHARRAIRRATTDELTGLFDVATGEKMIKVMLGQIGRGKLVLAMLDIDDFSKLRERCGAVACDAMIRSAARRLAGELAGRGNLCHVMNDTLLVALPYEGPDAGALDQVERLRLLMGGAMLDLARERLPVRASAGAAICPQNGRAFAELYEKADMALFWSKRAGKDRTTLYRESGGPPERGDGTKWA